MGLTVLLSRSSGRPNSSLFGEGGVVGFRWGSGSADLLDEERDLFDDEIRPIPMHIVRAALGNDSSAMGGELFEVFLHLTPRLLSSDFIGWTVSWNGLGGIMRKDQDGQRTEGTGVNGLVSGLIKAVEFIRDSGVVDSAHVLCLLPACIRIHSFCRLRTHADKAWNACNQGRSEDPRRRPGEVCALHCGIFILQGSGGIDEDEAGET